MSFMDSYKRLEKLCGDVLNDERKISAYIDKMINTPNGRNLVDGWDDDLKQLKHYRWIRNKIAHEPNCTESNMCTRSDTKWINNFYSRVLKQKDPISLYSKANKSRSVHRSRKKGGKRKNKIKLFGILIVVIAVLLIIAIKVIFTR